MTAPVRRGFTVIELLTAVAIIVVLMAIALPAVTYAVKRSRMTSTLALMGQVRVAVEAYLEIYPKIGDDADSADFAATPWLFLARRPTDEGRKAFLEMPVKHLAKGTDPAFTAATERDAEHICDAFPAASGCDPLLWKISNDTAAGSTKPFTKVIMIRSRCGTPADPADDLVLRYSTDTGRFDQKQWSEVEAEWGP